MATASVVHVTPVYHYRMVPERIEALLRGRRARLTLDRFTLCDKLDLSWNKISWVDSGEEPPDGLTMGEILLIARTVYAVPKLNDCEGVNWDERTPYGAIREAGGWVELLFVDPLLQQDANTD